MSQKNFNFYFWFGIDKFIWFFNFYASLMNFLNLNYFRKWMILKFTKFILRWWNNFEKNLYLCVVINLRTEDCDVGALSICLFSNSLTVQFDMISKEISIALRASATRNPYWKSDIRNSNDSWTNEPIWVFCYQLVWLLIIEPAVLCLQTNTKSAALSIRCCCCCYSFFVRLLTNPSFILRFIFVCYC